MKESEIRPLDIFDEYLRLAEQDSKIFFEHAERDYGLCPACSGKGKFTFIKNGFCYEECPNCNSLFVNPRPAAECFNKYYTESASSEYWATTFYKETAEARREKLWGPKAQLILEKLKLYEPGVLNLVDIGGGYGLFAEEIKRISKYVPYVIEPSPQLSSVCRNKGIPVIEKFLEEIEGSDLPKGIKIFTSFELFEHLHDPASFLKHLLALMTSKDLFIFTTLSSAGIDIQVLWENSKSVTPPHHLNFLNPNSIECLLKNIGYDVLEVTTPGKLDIDILSNNQEFIKDRFWLNFVRNASAQDKEIWQKLLVASGLSSHMMVVCRKP